jgi:hypothetical protein
MKINRKEKNYNIAGVAYHLLTSPAPFCPLGFSNSFPTNSERLLLAVFREQIVIGHLSDISNI